MNMFDQWVKHTLKARYYIRYADDFVFMSTNRAWLVDLVPRIKDFLTTELTLTLHPKKIFIKTITSGVDFLGWTHFYNHRTLRSMTKNRMLRRVREHPTMETLQSYLGLLGHGNTTKTKDEVLLQYWLWQ